MELPKRRGPIEQNMDTTVEEFGIVDEPCYFCGHKQTVRFNEHYNFCPQCSAIYTNMFVVKGCKHIKGSAIVVERIPQWHDTIDWKNKLYVMSSIRGFICSKCNGLCEVDGW